MSASLPLARLSAPQRAALVVAVIAGYFAAGKLGLSFASVNSSVTAVWPPTGIAIATLLIFGYSLWPAIFIGAFLVNLSTSGAVFVSLGIAAGNMLEGMAGAYLISRFAGGDRLLARPQNLFRFVAAGALAAPVLSATIGVVSLALGGLAQPSALGPVWLTWWLGDMSGALLLVPLLVLWHHDHALWPKERRVEVALVYLAIVGSGLLVFRGPVFSTYPTAFLCMPALVWAAVRFAPRDVIAGVVLLATIATVSTVSGLGPFAVASTNARLLILQGFMATVTLVMLTLAGLVDELRQRNLAERSARTTAETASRAKDEFLAILSHELRNPLAAITAATGLLRTSRTSNPASTHAVDVLGRQAKHMTDIVEDLLDVSRVSSGKLTITRELVELTVVIARAVESCKPLIDSRGHRLDLALPERPVWASGDLTRLSQVVQNLLANAAKYTPTGGSIRIVLSAEGGSAVIRVIDSGTGISPAVLPHIFDVFVQDEKTLEHSEGGIGVGLALAHKIVELHGGSIDAKSGGQGMGAEFVVQLPLAAEQPYPARVAGHSTQQMFPRGQGRRVLVVDDNVDAATTLAEVLRARGNDVRVAHDVDTAMKIARAHLPEVALLDIELPDGSGYELANRLREIDGARHMVLVAITGYGREKDHRRSRQAGFSEHLVKPVPVEYVEQLLSMLPPQPPMPS